MKTRWQQLMCATVVAAVSLGAAAQTAAPKLVLVELFTSEGCSSCPPADELLAKLNGKATQNGHLIVGISEHVTYWNQLGWADPFSAQVYTDRQSGYGERFRLESVYTPQMVVNGEREALGSDGAAVMKAISDAGGGVEVKLGVPVVAGRSVTESYTVVGRLPVGAEVWAVVADDMRSSKVLRGENGGRELTHVSVARSVTRVGSGAAGTFTVALPVDGDRARHLIVFAQAAGFGKVLGVGQVGLGR